MTIQEIRNVKLVLSGGGVKGFAMAGAVIGLEDCGVVPVQLAGTSSGAMVAALVAAGYTGEELAHIVESADLATILGIGGEDWQAGTWMKRWWRTIQAVQGKGWVDGARLEKWMAGWLQRKGVRVFGDLPAGRLKVVVADIVRHRLIVIPDDLPDGRRFSVAKAVRMSASIPFLFAPVSVNDSFYVDGSLLSNTPIFAIDSDEQRLPIVAVSYGGVDPTPVEAKTQEGPVNLKKTKRPTSAGGPFKLLHALIETMLSAHDDYVMRQHPQVIRISLPSLGIQSTDFHIRKEQMKQLVREGATAATLQWVQAESVFALTYHQWKRFGR